MRSRLSAIFLVLLACSSSSSKSAFDQNDDAGVPAPPPPPAPAPAPPGTFGDSGTVPKAIPVRKIPGLVSITYYETSGTVSSYKFDVNGPEMSAKLATVDETTHDIKGVDTEFYDVYYSDENGNFDIDGAYLTIAGVFGYALPAGGGLNLAEISLDYSGKPAEFGNYVASAVYLGDNQSAGSAALAIDGKLETCSTMGNTVGSGGKELRVTLGFASSSGPPK